MGVILKYFSLCKNFHSKAGVGVNSDMGVISEEYGTLAINTDASDEQCSCVNNLAIVD